MRQAKSSQVIIAKRETIIAKRETRKRKKRSLSRRKRFGKAHSLERPKSSMVSEGHIAEFELAFWWGFNRISDNFLGGRNPPFQHLPPLFKISTTLIIL